MKLINLVLTLFIVFLLALILFFDSKFRKNIEPEKPKIETVKKPAQKATKEKVDVFLPDSNYIPPKGFLWGVALSAFQNDGGDGKTDWDEWPSYKKSKAYHPGFNKKDIALAREFGIKSIRFSIEWARAETVESEWDKKILKYYTELVREMKKNKIEPFVNLNHFTLPFWVARKGGWENDSTPIWFSRYAKKIAETFKPLKIKWWMTFNEPTVIASEGYLNGNFPPQKKNDIRGLLHVRRNLIKAHHLAVKNLRKILDTDQKKIMVGIAHPADYFVAEDKKDEKDQQVAAALDYLVNFAFIDAIQNDIDYIGINYYKRAVVRFNSWGLFFFGGTPVEFVEPKDSSTDIFAEGLFHLIKAFKVYGKPIIITENGVNDNNDKKRPKFLIEHISYIWKATQEKNNNGENDIPIIGYFYWTLFDSYEWSYLKTSHFGLFSVNHADSSRIPRKSAYLYQDIIRANGITKEIIKKYLK
ncbi:MAG: family 1 glycosylhydrolase [Patescibacteria group bacterium]|nr:family 1 glycosylhydrolase [Patescibacteria group bacterium]